VAVERPSLKQRGIDFVVATGAVDRFKKWGMLITYYPASMRAGLGAFDKTRTKLIGWVGLHDVILKRITPSPI